MKWQRNDCEKGKLQDRKEKSLNTYIHARSSTLHFGRPSTNQSVAPACKETETETRDGERAVCVFAFLFNDGDVLVFWLLLLFCVWFSVPLGLGAHHILSSVAIQWNGSLWFRYLAFASNVARIWKRRWRWLPHLATLYDHMPPLSTCSFICYFFFRFFFVFLFSIFCVSFSRNTSTDEEWNIERNSYGFASFVCFHRLIVLVLCAGHMQTIPTNKPTKENQKQKQANCIWFRHSNSISYEFLFRIFFLSHTHTFNEIITKL